MTTILWLVYSTLNFTDGILVSQRGVEELRVQRCRIMGKNSFPYMTTNMILLDF